MFRKRVLFAKLLKDTVGFQANCVTRSCLYKCIQALKWAVGRFGIVLTFHATQAYRYFKAYFFLEILKLTSHHSDSESVAKVTFKASTSWDGTTSLPYIDIDASGSSKDKEKSAHSFFNSWRYWDKRYEPWPLQQSLQKTLPHWDMTPEWLLKHFRFKVEQEISQNSCSIHSCIK